MAELQCHECGHPLGHIDEACPRCLPNFYGPPAPPKPSRAKAAYLAGLTLAHQSGPHLLSEAMELEIAAAIEAALAEQRARIEAYCSEMAKRLNEISAETVRKGLDSSPDILAAKMVEQLVCAIRDGEPEAWAERTGWKMKETGDDEDS